MFLQNLFCRKDSLKCNICRFTVKLFWSLEMKYQDWFLQLSEASANFPTTISILAKSSLLIEVSSDLSLWATLPRSLNQWSRPLTEPTEVTEASYSLLTTFLQLWLTSILLFLWHILDLAALTKASRKYFDLTDIALDFLLRMPLQCLSHEWV